MGKESNDQRRKMAVKFSDNTALVQHPKCRVIFSLDIRAGSCARHEWRCDVGKESVKEYGSALEG